MPDYLMLLLMQITIFSSVTACIIIFVKQLFKWVIPPSVGVIMWLILLIRLVWPIFPESSFSVYNLIPAGRNIMYTLTNDLNSEISKLEDTENPYVIQQPTVTDVSTASNAYRQNQLYPEEDTPLTVGEYVTDTVYSDKTRSEVAHITEYVNIAILSVYAFGVIIAVTVYTLKYRKAKRNALNTSLPCCDERTLRVYMSAAEKIGIRPSKIPPLKYGSSTMLAGCFKPTVIYNEREELSDRELSMIFAHELNHFKHRDNFVLMFSSYVACLFWYNPLIWIVRHMLREDIEVMCDSRTVSRCDIRRTEYAQLIYASSDYDKRALFAGCHMSTGSRQLKHRLRTISRNLENKLIPRITSAVLCLCIIVVCLTNPIISQNIKYADYIDNYSALTGESERTMHLTSDVSVSFYLKQISTLLTENFDKSISQMMGNGSLENLKRLVNERDIVAPDVAEKLNSMLTDQTLTSESCAVINYCIVKLLAEDIYSAEDITLPILPKVISVQNMNMLQSKLSHEDLETVSKYYNRGVAGAEVSFEPYYTEAMFNLILSRMDSQESRAMWDSFYSKINLKNEKSLTALCEKYGIDKAALKNEEFLYIISPNVSAVEAKLLRNLIRSAYAGQDESAYYLKANIEGYAEYALQLTLSKSGYSVEDMISDYARLGVPQYEYYTMESCEILSKEEYDIIGIRLEGSGISIADCYSVIEGTDYYHLTSPDSSVMPKAIEYLNAISFVTIRSCNEDGIYIDGFSSNNVKRAIAQMYDLGLIDAQNSVIDLEETVSCGQSLYYSYKLVCSIINANR